MRERTLERTLQGSLDLASLLITWYLTLALPLYRSPAAGYAPWARGSAALPPISHVVALWFLVALWAGVYGASDEADRWADVRIASRAAMALVFAVTTAHFFWARGRAAPSPSFALVLTGLSFVLFTLSRLGARAAARTLAEHWRVGGRVAVLGCDPEAISILEHLRVSGKDSVRGLIAPEGRRVSEFGSGPVLGSTRELAELINREKLDRIVMSNSSLCQAELETL